MGESPHLSWRRWARSLANSVLAPDRYAAEVSNSPAASDTLSGNFVHGQVGCATGGVGQPPRLASAHDPWKARKPLESRSMTAHDIRPARWTWLTGMGLALL